MAYIFMEKAWSGHKASFSLWVIFKGILPIYKAWTKYIFSNFLTIHCIGQNTVLNMFLFIKYFVGILSLFLFKSENFFETKYLFFPRVPLLVFQRFVPHVCIFSRGLDKINPQLYRKHIIQYHARRDGKKYWKHWPWNKFLLEIIIDYFTLFETELLLTHHIILQGTFYLQTFNFSIKRRRIR